MQPHILPGRVKEREINHLMVGPSERNIQQLGKRIELDTKHGKTEEHHFSPKLEYFL